MARRAARASAEQVILEAVENVVARASAGIAKAIAEILAVRIDAELRNQVSRAVGKGKVARGSRGRPAARQELDRWVADRRARRVPNFVIEATGLKTKKQIVARFGENATFEKDKPLPKAR